MLTVISIFFLVVIIISVTAGLTKRFTNTNSYFYHLDHPTDRSLHVDPTPRTGGVAIVLVSFIAISLFEIFIGSDYTLTKMWTLALIVAGISFLDDRSSLSPALRLFIHVSVGIFVVLLVGMPDTFQIPGLIIDMPGIVSSTLLVLFIVWFINLYNFMDGMDGLAGGMSVIGFGAISWMAWDGGNTALALTSLIVASASAGFLILNFPPAKIFMGDTGSSYLGFMAAWFLLWAERERTFPIWAGLLIFSPFIVDATVTLLIRALKREPIWRAHKQHFYQKLVQTGWGHRKTVLGEYTLMILCASSALIAVKQPPVVQWAVLALWAVTYIILMMLISKIEIKFKQEISDSR